MFWDFEQNIAKHERIEFELIEKKRNMYVYDKNGEYVAGMSIQPKNAKTIYLSYLVVKEKFRNRTIGTQMISYACNLSKNRAYHSILLNVDLDNINAKRLYEKLRFKLTEKTGR